MLCGTRSKYVEGCRCEDCTFAQNEYQRAWYKRRPKKSRATVKRIVARAKKRALATAPHIPGTTGMYAVGCRCDGCRAAHREYCRVRDGVKPANYRK